MQVYRVTGTLMLGTYAGHRDTYVEQWITGTLMLGVYAGHRIAYAGHWVTGSPIYSTSVVLLIIFCLYFFLYSWVILSGHRVIATIF